jgi:O-methyltransferase involved in polyketide biosynthesis
MKPTGMPGLDGVQSTLLMPLWARAIEAQRQDAILRDEAAGRIVAALPFDFEHMRNQRVPVADYCIRSVLVDRVVTAEMRARPAAPVIEFGVGLDTRFDRLSDGRRWFEIDFPEVVALRRRFFPDAVGRSMLSARLPNLSWMDDLDLPAGEPPIFVAEGVLYFLSTAEVRDLFTRLAERHPGASFIFDAQSPLFLTISNLAHPLNRRTSRLRFALGPHGREIAAWDPRLVVERYIGFGDRPEYASFLHRLSPFKRCAAALHPLTRHSFKVLLVRLGQHAAT